MLKILRRILLVFPLLMLTACLIPVEEVYEPLPTVDEGTKRIVATSVCTREDLQVTVRLEVRYVPVRTQDLYFPEDNVPYGEFFVMAGDTVNEGDLLAKLDTEALDEQYESISSQLKDKEAALNKLNEDYEIQKRRQAVLNETLSWQDRVDAEKRIEESYALNKEKLDDDVYLLKLRLDVLHEKIERRKLYAPFSAIVTFIYQPERTDISQHTKRIAAVADSSQSIFRGDTLDYEVFQPGNEYTVTADKKDYLATVVSEAELGLPEQETVEGKRKYVYLRLNEPAFDIKDSARGLIYAVKEESKNTLTVPVRAVSKVNGKDVVYCPAESGIRMMREVTLGISNGSRVEILSGLSEGDIVITN